MTNGDVCADALRSCGALPLVVWRDVLHAGPVPAGLSVEALAAVRAAFLASHGWTDFAEALALLHERDAALLEAHEGTLWFEHDLYDQLQLVQVLAMLASRPSGAGTWRLVEAPPPLRIPNAEARARMESNALALGDDALALAVRAWAALCAPDPRPAAALLETDLSALPHLRAAWERWLEELPAPGSGLPRTERQLLQVLAAGPLPFPSLFVRWSSLEALAWMGDSTLLLHLRGLAHAGAVALAPEGWQLTDTGRALLRGGAELSGASGARAWWGGTCLAEPSASGWRWDPASRALLAPHPV
ncbi:hypothetical protein FGE12_04725 [Aggregicoccus sp. 17bor-14]|uniref:hypothetical protein n=1 Tax=Myxococcaceae TaxID=31 RepID=UPI00129C58ED|nr:MULTISPECIES: hypothetical protein [Myxococcaceae]MBF5041684.1 hypothetical protein [Simulacricoccus sp. 17bor-14]MRI87466.1 hypothetical protein [Aggregicoccus sp. 17bor-14]